MTNILNATIQFSSDIDLIFSAMAHPIRRQIIELLTFKALEVRELDKNFEISKPALVKHLDILEKAGIVEREKEKRRCLCKLNSTPLKEIKDYFDFYTMFWK